MAEYIEREAAIMTAMNYDGNGNAQDASQDIASALSALPSADVRPVVRARWNRRYDDFMKSTYDTCSNCGMEYFGAKGFRFCPNCGADMREVDDG